MTVGNRTIPVANLITALVALLLVLTTLFLPLLQGIAEGSQPYALVSVLGDTPEALPFNFDAARIILVSSLVALAASLAGLLVAGVQRISRYVVLVAGLLNVVAYVRMVFLGEVNDISIVQLFEVGYWVGLLLSVILALQALLPGASDPVVDGLREHMKQVRITRQQVLSALLLLLGGYLFLSAPAYFDSGTITTLALESGSPDEVAHIDVPTRGYLMGVGVFYVLVGVLGLFRIERLHRATSWLLVIAGIMIFPTAFIVAASGGSTNAITMLTESLRLSTPIAIGAMAGIWCERSGVINIAIEGMMLFAAAIGFTALFLLRDIFPPDQINLLLFIAVMTAVLSGGIAALLHAWLSITFATDQIVSGTVINILALGTTSFLRREVLLSTDAGLTTLPTVRIPILADIPIIGEALFNNKPIFYMMFVVIIVTYIVLFHTRWGLRTRAVGENPHAADTLGIKVNRMRWMNVFIGGLIAGLAGAWFSLEATGRFTDNMTNGSGFISLAAMIFGKWHPAGAFGGSLLFGFSDALGTRFQIIDVQLPPQFLQMVPYVVTLIVLAGLVGRAIPPKAVGKPYKKEE